MPSALTAFNSAQTSAAIVNIIKKYLRKYASAAAPFTEQPCS